MVCSFSSLRFPGPLAGSFVSRSLMLVQRHRQTLALIPAALFVGLLVLIRQGAPSDDARHLMLVGLISLICLMAIGVLIYASVPQTPLPAESKRAASSPPSRAS